MLSWELYVSPGAGMDVLNQRMSQKKKKREKTKEKKKKYSPIGTGYYGRRVGHTDANREMTFPHADKDFPGSIRVLMNLPFYRCPDVYSDQALCFFIVITEMASLV